MKNLNRALSALNFTPAVAPAAASAPAISGQRRSEPRVARAVMPGATVVSKRRTERDPNSLLSNNQRLFRYVGCTTLKGATKLWFANELEVRQKNMLAQGHTNIQYVTLPEPLTKEQAVQYLQNNPGLLPAELLDHKAQRLTQRAAKQAREQALTTGA